MVAAMLAFHSGSAQNNSPYSRYGLGDAVPQTHIVNRAMGGVAVADTSFNHVNFVNPASYSSFLSIKDPGSRKLALGRVLLDLGVNLENRTLREPNSPGKFTSADLYVNYLQFGIPLRKNWGLAFGIRQLNRVRYHVDRRTRLTGIDTLLTEYNGSGGVYLPSIGTGYSFGKFSVGINAGYLFGNREARTATGFLNDTVTYQDGLYKTETSFGKFFLQGGAQYRITLQKTADRYRYIHLGVSGNLQQKLNASRDITQGVFTTDPSGALSDSISVQKDVKGTIIYPGSYTAGFIVGGYRLKKNTWQFGMDYVHTGWSAFRSYGATDAVQDDWQIRVGGMIQSGFLAYRGGFFTGRDYINIGGEIPVWGASLGVGIPLVNYNRQSPDQGTTINLAIEYNSRGNNKNVLKENMFRVSAGFNLSDLWFKKRKYD